MKRDLENSDWMNEAPYLAGLGVNHPFTVPEGYFEELSGQIHQAIFLEKLKSGGLEEKGFNGTEGPSGFVVPDAYFEGLTQDIQSRLSAERLKAIAPDEGYAVPNDYFNQLQAKITARATGAEQLVHGAAAPRAETPIRRLWHSNLLKYASAACFVLVSAAGFYFYPQAAADKNKSADFSNEQMLYDIDEGTIIEHIQSNNLEKEKPLMADSDLENYILTNYSQNEIASNL